MWDIELLGGNDLTRGKLSLSHQLMVYYQLCVGIDGTTKTTKTL